MAPGRRSGDRTRYPTTAVQDVPDLRDWPYEPTMKRLSRYLAAPRGLSILDQAHEGTCTGFGLAAVINLLNKRRGSRVRGQQMAEFDLAYAKTSAHEGGYAKDPIDRGGETYRGIARLRHPGWAGWERIDAHKRKGAFPDNLAADRTLQARVRTFYRSVFWDRCRGDELADQALANELYDSAVNLGVRRAVRFLQSSLNLLNRNQRDYADLIEDGWFGRKTLAALDALLKKDRNSEALVKMMNIHQGARYIEIMAADPGQERFARGWIRRA
jgi:lysozyme family protein